MKQEFFKTDINFMGFYNSIHSDAIGFYFESSHECFDTESECNDECKEWYETEEYESVNWRETYKNYSEKLFNDVFLPALNDAINELLISKKEYNFSKHITFNTLWSPREYNFHSDKIVVNFSKKLMNFIWNKIDKNHFNEWLLQNKKSYSGFISFFTGGLNNDKWLVPVDNWNDCQDSILIEYLLRNFDREKESYFETCIDSCLVFNNSEEKND
jgi:hypothetical protein